MTTVEDKLKLFAKIIFEKVEKESALRVTESTKEYDLKLEQEKQNILKESDMLITQLKKRAETKKNQIISKANIEMQHELLKKRKELYDRVVEDIKILADKFTKSAEYPDFLEKSIKNCLSQIDAEEITIVFSQYDLENNMDLINKAVKRYKNLGMTAVIEATNKAIIGGCICEDRSRTKRVDCSMLSIIEDNRTVIGKALVDNLN
ncbi:V-type proton ATPase subunit E [Oxobacter pfennigii]|uniref:V-type proton ATPase subunit E n=1 Tax=Oxobacter pfennigii TaxID=36849 RepID=A0A0P9ALK0_9CLOT|nr:V-type ATP synthase subunit E [Oxobacter pfennigii]KPU46250.1 V-type proton ATPase subunit E [Oxobacter pfennigii]